MDRVDPETCPAAFFAENCETFSRYFNAIMTKMAGHKLLIDIFKLLRGLLIAKFFLVFDISKPGQLERWLFNKQYPPVD